VNDVVDEMKKVLASKVGLFDRTREGWLDNSTGQLIEGVRIRSTDTVVDIGCGDGGFINFCANQGAEVIFVDRNEDRVKATEERVKPTAAHLYQAIVSDCDPIPLEDGRADVLICTEVLEHVPDPDAFLAELVRVTRPGGQLLLTVPDSRSEQLVAATAPTAYFQEPNHIRVFSADDFRALVYRAGLTIESQNFMGCFWSVYWPLAWLTAEAGDGQLPINSEHPICEAWAGLWKQVQEHPDGDKLREAFNSVLPKSQNIVARKPA
jgi:ubiquinone/menaquinone biosynthesis C-methylase UbiE